MVWTDVHIKFFWLYLLQQIKAHQFYTDLGLLSTVLSLQNIVEFKDFSRILSDFQVLFKVDLIFKDFSKKPSKFKYFSRLCKPWICFGER